MARSKGPVLIQAERQATCAYCGTPAELRPYGEGGAKICFPCAMRPENVATTERLFEDRLGVTHGDPSAQRN